MGITIAYVSYYHATGHFMGDKYPGLRHCRLGVSDTISKNGSMAYKKMGNKACLIPHLQTKQKINSKN